MFFSLFLFIPFAQNSSDNDSQDIDLIQLEKKINDGELKELKIRNDEIVATDRRGTRQYRVFVSNESTRAEILRQARELNANGEPRVPRVEEETSRRTSAALPIGFGVLFIAHAVTILLVMGLMPLYLILAVKNAQLDQTMRIVWIVLICTLGMFAMPAYWYVCIWRNKPPTGIVTSTT